MNSTDSQTTGPRIELRVRHAVQPPVQDRISEIRSTLDRLEASDRIADWEVVVWGRLVDLDPETETTGHTETYVEFAAWAARNGYDLGPGFCRRRCTSLVSSEEHPVVTVPLVSLAVFQGDELLAVYPHTAGDVVATVADGLAELTSRQLQGPVRPSAPQ